jgi:DNA-binding GntR family transcriptional regulator
LTRVAAASFTSTNTSELAELEDVREGHVQRQDFAAALAANRRFHERINSIARNPQASAILDSTWILIAALWHRHGYGPERFAGVANDHNTLIRALQAKDSDAAATLMSAHVIKAKYDLLARMVADAPRAAGRIRRRRIPQTESETT